MKTSLDTNQLLAQMQQLAKVAKAGANSGVNPVAQTNSEFSNLFSKAIDSVNARQMEAGRLANQVETGDGGVSLVKAMIASQKAGVAFQATVQVRNRLVSAYQDIMNMPI
jgi:flagellar hook-basal body complex protein FliE